MTDAALHEDRPLDDVLLAMDVVDTLRHRDLTLLKELDEAGRETQLVERLREIYRAQGIEVPDHVIKEGVQALKEKRFAYTPPKPSFSVTLAKIYVSRGRWMGLVAAGFAAIALALGIYQFGISGPAKAKAEKQRLVAAAQAETLKTDLEEILPAELTQIRTAISDISDDSQADRLAEGYFQSGVAALDRRNADEARSAIENLKALRTDLASVYDVRVVYGANEPRSGITRLNDDAPGRTNYYLIVEAISPTGAKLERTVVSQEDNETRRTTRWGQQVSEAAFYRVSADKQDDRIIQDAIIGQKSAGKLDPVYTIETTGGAILEW